MYAPNTCMNIGTKKSTPIFVIKQLANKKNANYHGENMHHDGDNPGFKKGPMGCSSHRHVISTAQPATAWPNHLEAGWLDG